MKNKRILYYSALLLFPLWLGSCEGFFDNESRQVIFVEDNSLDGPTDTVYSVIGIINRMQKVADRTVLLGELRGDLVQVTPNASVNLQAIADFEADRSNPYNAPQDYYNIINNCNFYLAHVDTSLKKRNNPVFVKEYAVVKAFRAWTYLQLALVYGNIPFVTEPIIDEKQLNKIYDYKDIKGICNYFIDDLKPFIDTEWPSYGTIAGLNSQQFYIPIRLLLGDLCLWADRYLEAATYYHDFLTNINKPLPVGNYQVAWPTNTSTFDTYINDRYSSLFRQVSGDEVLSFIPMESSRFDGTVSELADIFNSTVDNHYYFEVTISKALYNLSRSQSYCKVFNNEATASRDTLYAPNENILGDLYVGDLRLKSIYNRSYAANTSLSTYSTDYQYIAKIGTHIWTYRRALVYLTYAEALN